MGAYIALGATTLPQQPTSLQWLLVTLADQPFIPQTKLKLLIGSLHTHQKSIMAADYFGKGGVPAVFKGTYFERLTHLEGDQGTRAIILNTPQEEILYIEIEEAAQDIDRPDDVTRWGSSIISLKY